MADEELPTTIDTPVVDTPAPEQVEPSSEPRQEVREPSEPAPQRSVRELLQAEFDKAKTAPDDTPRDDRPRDPQGKFVKAEEAPTEATPAQKSPTPAKAAQPAGAQVPAGPPPGWASTAKAAWASLPPDVQQSVIKREQEVSNGFKAKADELKAIQESQKSHTELDEVLKPHQELFKAHGRSNADVVRQLLGWFSALSHPNQDVRSDSMRLLARSFNVDLGSPAQQTPAAAASPEPAQPQLPPELAPFLPVIEHLVEQRVRPINQQFSDLTQSQINDHITSWSTDKPYFAHVKGLMGTLIQSGQIPILANGRPDLDAAYQMATNAHPQIRAEISSTERAKWEADLTAKRAEEERVATEKVAEEKRLSDAERARQDEERRKKAASARAASVSVPASAPVGNQPKQGKPKDMSVRESLAAAMQELRA